MAAGKPSRNRRQTQFRRDEITADVAAEFLSLERETGRLFWRVRDVKWFKCEKDCRRWNSRYAGTEAFTAQRNGYRVGYILSSLFQAHRVVFAIVNGRWPHPYADHIDGNPSNNKPENLREASAVENGRNARSRGGASKFVGVSPRGGKWRASFKDDAGRKRFIGTYETDVEAAVARDSFVSVYYGEFARLNFPGGSNG